ncbi:MAG: M13 family metallopeptidase [Bacteroidales bacterium]|nr:M13 family metallopeptidase [Bacteroidales bacterium]
MKKVFLIMAAAMVIAGCGAKQDEKVPAIDLANLDTTVAPGEDFYQYSTGGWQKNNPLGAEYARFGSFDMLRETNVERLNDLFKNMTTLKTEKGSVEQKIADLYKMGLDSVRLNAEGAEPIKKYLDAIYAVSDKSGLVKMVADLHNSGESAFFGVYVEADMMDSDNQILYLGQGGLGIGNRDYYVDPKNAELKEGYRNFLAKVFGLAGIADPATAAANALAVEDVIAIHSWDSVQERDVEAQYNPMSTAELLAKYPGFDFATYFAQRGIPAQDKLVVAELSYFEGFAKYFATADLAALKDYVAGQFIQGACGSISDDFTDASFDFFSRQMSGIQQQKPRWKRAMSVPNSILGEAVGKMYVAKYFPESSKTRMVELVKNLQIALGQHIDELDWMSAETKVKAHEKLESFTVKIGYPDTWKDYSTLEIDPQKSYYENMKAASEWYVADNMSKLGKPTDRTEWGMTPQTVNAYYNPTTNEICFPAAILQPPFFNADADDPVNYGGIGVVIGHEMSHGFDDQGRLFDARGNMSGWWTAEDDERFRAKAEILAAQFDKVEIIPGLMANGHNTLGENIGDHGGLSIAYSAMLNALEGKEQPLIDGFTPAQRFYLSYGAIWAQNITDEEKARLTMLDVHSLAVNRVNVSVKNFQTFYDAFGIKEGDPMFLPESERVHIW